MEQSFSPLSMFDPASVSDVDMVRALLIAAARAGEPVSYSGLLADLGHRFTRPKMRAVCKTLDVIDRAAREAGEPEMAVLVVRESDGLPGQGWWVGEQADRRARDQGVPDQVELVRRLQAAVFDYWKSR